MRTSTKPTTALALMLALTLTACTDQTPDQETATAQIQAAACLTTSVEAAITLQRAGSTPTRAALITLTNTTDAPCTLDGWLTVTLVNAAREVVKVPTRKLDAPTQSQPFEIQPGGTGYAGLRWTSCEKSAPTCPVGANLRTSLALDPNGPTATLKDFPTPRRSRLTMADLKVGTLNPSPDQALNW